ncbi:MAG: VanZ family protein [Gammaproteobacteria bacterium]|jgi:VanZ family protein|nr:VanZ family protein [Gammaproteobacteria bacterium]
MTSLLLTDRILLTLCFMLLLVIASLIPGYNGPGDFAFTWLFTKTPKLLQKLLHFCLYGVLALLLFWTFDGTQSRASRLLVSYLIAVAFGAVMEWCQTRVSGRFGTMQDVAINAAGAALGLLLAAYLL